jgi:hypothetical protein
LLLGRLTEVAAALLALFGWSEKWFASLPDVDVEGFFEIPNLNC